MMMGKRKLGRQDGFTLGETLLAVLIMLLVTGITATGIPTIRNAYQKVVNVSNAEVLLSTAVAKLRDEIGTAWKVVVNPSRKSVTYFSANTGANTKINLGKLTDSPDSSKMTIFKLDYAPYAINDSLIIDPSNPADRGYRLVSEAASTGDLYVTYEGVNSAGDPKTVVQFTGLKVIDAGTDRVMTTYGNDGTLSIAVMSGDVTSAS